MLRLCFLFVFICNIIVRLILNISWGINVIVRFEIVRFRNKCFKVVEMDEVFCSVRIMRRFLRVVMMENVKFNMERISINVL